MVTEANTGITSAERVPAFTAFLHLRGLHDLKKRVDALAK